MKRSCKGLTALWRIVAWKATNMILNLVVNTIERLLTVNELLGMTAITQENQGEKDHYFSETRNTSSNAPQSHYHLRGMWYHLSSPKVRKPPRPTNHFVSVTPTTRDPEISFSRPWAMSFDFWPPWTFDQQWQSLRDSSLRACVKSTDH